MRSTHDANGNTLSDASGRSFTWDFENRLMQVVNPGVGTTTFRYDPFGRRIQKSGLNGTTNYLYDGINLLEEVDSTGNVLARYMEGLNVDEPIAELRSSSTSYYERDGLGSVTSLSAASGTIQSTYAYDSFGNLSSSTGTTANPFRYTSRESDSEVGLYYYRARYYDPLIGRFVNQDPLADESSSAYEYANNNPGIYIDFDGLAPLTTIQGQSVANTAATWIGTPYVSGGHTQNGADCSGSTWAIYTLAGFQYSSSPVPTANFLRTMVRSTHTPGYFYPVSQPQVGDIMFWGTHMAVYDPNAQHTCGCQAQQGSNMFSATHPGGGPYTPANSTYWFNGRPPVYYRYDAPDPK